MKFRVVTMLIGLSFLLTACSGSTFNETFGLSGVYNWGCNSNQEKTAKTAKWDQALTVTEVIKDGTYKTGVLMLRVGIPHIIEITNLDKQSRSFRAESLFKKSSIFKVVHEGEQKSAPCLQGVAIAPQKTSEIYLVPLEKGYYDYHETFWTTPGLNLLPFIAPMGAIGYVYVH